MFLRDARIEDVIRFVLVTNQLEQRVLSSNTLFVYAGTAQKLKDFQELQVRNFYLTNASAKDVSALLKSMAKIKDMYINEKLNLIVIRDTPEAIRVAEKLIKAQDIAEPEVMLEVEVLEVGTNALDTLGVQYPSQISYSVAGAAGTAGSLTLNEFKNPNAGMVTMSISNPALVVNFLHQDGSTNLLANPKIRVKNHEKANIHIGDKVPVFTNTTTSTGVISQSVNYLDVGLKLDVEPKIHLDNEVDINVNLEVSSITNQIQDSSGGLAYQIGTRNATTILRLKDGETQILGGLINKSDQKSANGIPGLGQLPIIGRLFSNNSDTGAKTQVVMLITPRVLRNIVRPEPTDETFSSGTESLMSLDGLEFTQSDTGNSNTDNNSAGNNSEAVPAAGAGVPATVLPTGEPAKPANTTSSPSPSPTLGNAKLTLEAPSRTQPQGIYRQG